MHKVSSSSAVNSRLVYTLWSSLQTQTRMLLFSDKSCFETFSLNVYRTRGPISRGLWYFKPLFLDWISFKKQHKTCLPIKKKQGAAYRYERLIVERVRYISLLYVDFCLRPKALPKLNIIWSCIMFALLLIAPTNGQKIKFMSQRYFLVKNKNDRVTC